MSGSSGGVDGGTDGGTDGGIDGGPDHRQESVSIMMFLMINYIICVRTAYPFLCDAMPFTESMLDQSPYH